MPFGSRTTKGWGNAKSKKGVRATRKHTFDNAGSAPEHARIKDAALAAQRSAAEASFKAKRGQKKLTTSDAVATVCPGCEAVCRNETNLANHMMHCTACEGRNDSVQRSARRHAQAVNAFVNSKKLPPAVKQATGRRVCAQQNWKSQESEVAESIVEQVAGSRGSKGAQ